MGDNRYQAGGPPTRVYLDTYFSSTFGKPLLLTTRMKVAGNCVRSSGKDKCPPSQGHLARP